MTDLLTRPVASAAQPRQVESSPRRRHHPGRVPPLLALPALGGLVVMFVYPFVAILALAFTDSSLGRPLKAFAGTANFVTAWESVAFAGSLVRSTVFAVVAALAATVLGVALGSLLAARATRFGIVGSLLLLPLVTPPVMVGVAWKLMLAPVGGAFISQFEAIGLPGFNPLGGSSSALIALMVMHVWQWTPLATLLVYAAILTTDHETVEAAALDGAGRWRTFVHVMWPQISATAYAVALIQLVIGYKVFDLVAVVTQGGPGVSTVLASFEIFRTGLRGSYDIGTAAAQTLVFGLLVGLVATVVTAARARAVRNDR